ncbi:MAG: hypothetical protein BWK78_00450 [Thiotrichaceae bacterium IS1]|nr:MAG: hypothetical protein BWK78_00450 [Thiotrichaceae bacterium IS1]
MASTSFSIQIGNRGKKEVSISGEVDTRPDGLNQSKLGKTSGFDLGENVSVLIYTTGKGPLEIYWNFKSVPGASFRESSSTSIEVVDSLEFVNGASSATLSKAPSGGISICKWLGADLGALLLDEDGRTVRLAPGISSAKKYGVAVVKFTTSARVCEVCLPAGKVMESYGAPPYEVKAHIIIGGDIKEAEATGSLSQYC